MLAELELNVVSLATSDLLGEFHATSPEALPQSKMAGLNKDLKHAIERWVAGDDVMIHTALDRIEDTVEIYTQMPNHAGSAAAQKVVSAVNWIREDITRFGGGGAEPRNTNIPPSTPRPPSASPEVYPAAQAQRARQSAEQRKGKRRPSDAELDEMLNRRKGSGMYGLAT